MSKKKAPTKATKKSAPAESTPKATKKAASKTATAKKPKNGAGRSKFIEKQRLHLIELRDHLVDAMTGVAQDNLRSRADGSDSSAFGMHQADAGSDAYDRDFAMNLLSQEQDALYEIEEALKRIEDGTYGVCEMSGEPIPEARLEAIPFARLTVGCQAQLEAQMGGHGRSHGRPTRSLFGLMDNASDGDSVDND